MSVFHRIRDKSQNLAKLALCPIVVTLFFAAACQSKGERPAVADSAGTPGSAELAVLSAAEQEEIIDVLKSLSGDGPPTQVPVAGPQRGRWSDVPAAARAAAADQEFVIVHSETSAELWMFDLRSAGDRPAHIRVEKRPGDEIYSVSATVGLFARHTDAADDLVAAFERSMHQLSRKRRFPQGSD